MAFLAFNLEWNDCDAFDLKTTKKFQCHMIRGEMLVEIFSLFSTINRSESI